MLILKYMMRQKMFNASHGLYVSMEMFYALIEHKIFSALCCRDA